MDVLFPLLGQKPVRRLAAILASLGCVAATGAERPSNVLSMNFAADLLGYYTLEYERTVTAECALFAEPSFLRTRMGSALIGGPGGTIGARYYVNGRAPSGPWLFAELFGNRLNFENGGDRRWMAGAGAVAGYSWSTCGGVCGVMSAGAGLNVSGGGYRVLTGEQNDSVQILPVLRLNLGIGF